MTDSCREQILFIRDTGMTNMLDVGTVHRIARMLDYSELAEYLEYNRGAYVRFILTGKESFKK